MELRICVPYNSRSTAWASFDGRGRVELKRELVKCKKIGIALTHLPEGDHIKVTASKYPFPTVCADKQSTDWFHSISRTLKWNERERQKSFVVVEEEAKPRRRNKVEVKASDQPRVSTPDPTGGNLDEEDEVSDDEEEGRFDIDDSSPEAALSSIANTLTTQEALLGQEKAYDNMLEGTLQKAGVSLQQGQKRRSKSRSRSRSGVDTPGRYAGPHPHIPARDPRHVGFVDPADVSEPEQTNRHYQHESEDVRRPAGRSRISRGKDNNITPTVSTLPDTRSHSHVHRSKSADHHGRRAFAVWGHDESDSNASDSSADS